MSTLHTSLEKKPGANTASASQGTRTGVLLVHGLNGSQRDMAEMAHILQSHHLLVENILLPGHGTQVRDMLPIGWPEWSQAVRREVDALKQRCEKVFLVGHSLGGALCLHIAAHEEVAGVVTMCTPLHLFPWTKLAVGLARRVAPLLPTLREDVCDPVARRRYTRDVYRWTPMAPVESMLQHLVVLKSELPRITAPALIMVALHDHVVPARDGWEIYRLIGSKEKHLVTLTRSFHVVMKDHDREEVFEKTLAFIQHHSRKTTNNSRHTA
jgi:carboxylesterase